VGTHCRYCPLLLSCTAYDAFLTHGRRRVEQGLALDREERKVIRDHLNHLDATDRLVCKEYGTTADGYTLVPYTKKRYVDLTDAETWQWMQEQGIDPYSSINKATVSSLELSKDQREQIKQFEIVEEGERLKKVEG